MKKLLISLFVLVSFLSKSDNPLINHMYNADPTARVMNGKLFLFPSTDIPLSKVDKASIWKGNNSFIMPYYHCFSSTNLVNWKDYGIIIDEKNVPWAAKLSYTMWAPDCIEKDGKFYYYFPAMEKTEGLDKKGLPKRKFQIGLAVANHPEGPYKIKETPLEGPAGIDPNVFIDDDGQAYLFWSNGKYISGAKLKDDMCTLDGAAVNISELPMDYKEATFVFKRNGKYYCTFSTAKNSNSYLKYAVSDNVLSGYKMKGVIMDPWKDCWTNHHSLVKYNGKWILFYHHNDLSHNAHLRSVCADYLDFDEKGNIIKVKPTLRGIGICDAFDFIQVDRYSSCSKDIKILNNDIKGEKGFIISNVKQGSFVSYDRVNFGEKKYKKISFRVSGIGKGSIEVLDGSLKGKLIGKVDVDIKSKSEWDTITCKVDYSPKGVKDLYIKFSGSGYNLDWIQFK